MYYYILDLGNKKIVKIKEKMEMILSSFGISGDLGKISPLSSAYELAKRAEESGYTTIVAVGDSQIINQVAASLVNSKVAMGIIPIEAPISISKLIGTDSFTKALEILKVRKITKIDMGKISETKYFLTEAKIESKEPIPTVLDFENFKVGGSFSRVTILNGTEDKERYADGIFDILINGEDKKSGSLFSRFFSKKMSPYSIFHGKNITIETEEQTSIKLENEVVAKTPCTLTVLPSALNLIVKKGF